MPIASKKRMSMMMPSASTVGSSAPKHSMPTWLNWRWRPFCGRSARNIGPAYISLAGAAPCGTRSCCTTARTTPAVPSGRRLRRLFALMLPPSSRVLRFSPEMAVNISLETTSVASPMPRTNRSVCSNSGVSMGWYP